LKGRLVQVAIRYGPVLPLSCTSVREKEEAGATGTEEVTGIEVHDVGVILYDRSPAHLALLSGNRSLGRFPKAFQNL
jgi:hypothetical protein